MFSAICRGVICPFSTFQWTISLSLEDHINIKVNIKSGKGHELVSIMHSHVFTEETPVCVRCICDDWSRKGWENREKSENRKCRYLIPRNRLTFLKLCSQTYRMDGRGRVWDVFGRGQWPPWVTRQPLYERGHGLTRERQRYGKEPPWFQICWFQSNIR